jgi:hypothetical protein
MIKLSKETKIKLLSSQHWSDFKSCLAETREELNKLDTCRNEFKEFERRSLIIEEIDSFISQVDTN